MEKYRLGNSDISVTKLALGTANMKPPEKEGWVPREKSIALIRRVLDAGCNFIDTARVYETEEVVGEALAGRREQVVLATKMMQCKGAEVAGNVETSLRCLQTDYIDLYICHWPNSKLPMEEFLEAMAKQREAGKIRAIGTSNFNLEQMKLAAKYGAVSLQPPFSIVFQFPEETREFCRENNIAVTPYSPIAQGALAGRYTREGKEIEEGKKGNLLFTDEYWPYVSKVAKQVDAVADKLGCTSAQAALAWVLQTPGITGAICGASRFEQWEENVGALEVKIPPEDYAALDKAGKEVWKRFDPNMSMWGIIHN